MSDYEQEKKALKERIKKKQERVAFMLDAFVSGVKDANFITVDGFINLDISEKKKYYLNEGINFTPIEYTDTYLLFDTEINAGYSFGRHFHDKKEVCTVVVGELIDVSNNLRAKKGETMTFDAYKVHEPSAEEYTELRVKFYL